jgi:hypothetical protein
LVFGPFALREARITVILRPLIDRPRAADRWTGNVTGSRSAPRGASIENVAQPIISLSGVLFAQGQIRRHQHPLLIHYAARITPPLTLHHPQDARQPTKSIIRFKTQEQD